MTTTTTQILVTEELVSFKPLVIRETFTIQINGRPVIHPEFASRQAAEEWVAAGCPGAVDADPSALYI